jgi:hypothetical protein
MSSTLFSNASPFAAALPMGHTFFAYDADGDAIMTDAVSGLPITYGGSGSKRSRSASLDSDSTDSRPSKRSRTSSDEGDGAGDSGRGGAVSPIKIPRAPVGLPDACPPAPKKAPRSPHDDDADGDGHESALRNLAEQMAAAVLDGEPRDAPVATEASNAAAVPADVDGDGAAPPGGEPEHGWCVSVTCSDLALRLDMRHPRVVLNFLRFVSTYNELAPEGEDIHLPIMDDGTVEDILNHESVRNPVPEFAAEVAELRALVDRFSCHCRECSPGDYDDSDNDSDDSEESYRYRNRGDSF